MIKTLKAFWRIITFSFILIFRIIAFPFRVIRITYRNVYRYLNTDPDEDRDLVDSLASLMTESQTRASLWNHLGALRPHMLRATIMFVICCFLSFTYISYILDFLQTPLNSLTNLGLRISGPGNIFDIIPQIAFSSAFVLAVPYFIFEVFLYAAPGLRSRERKLGLILQAVFLIFFIASLAVGYYLILPNSLSVAFSMTSQFGIYDWELYGYLSFAAKILILSAIIVYYPLAIYLFSVSYNKPKIPLRLIVLISFSLAAAITPGTMVLIDIGLTIVLSLIYIPTYLAIMFLYKPQKALEKQ